MSEDSTSPGVEVSSKNEDSHSKNEDCGTQHETSSAGFRNLMDSTSPKMGASLSE